MKPLTDEQMRGPAEENVPATFKRLPREVRDIIYGKTLRFSKIEIPTQDEINQYTQFPEIIGDCTGFFWSPRDCESLSLCKALRAEILPVAYENTSFEARDMDDMMKLLIAMGSVGRRSVGHLDFPWESAVDSEQRWQDENGAMALPSLHVRLCLYLLAECVGLKSLTLRFEPFSLAEIPLNDFQRDEGIAGLASIKHVGRVSILDYLGDSLDDQAHIQWLKHEMETAALRKGITNSSQ
jgi:hypothetical protein